MLPSPRLKSPILETMNEEGEKEVLQVIDEFVNLHDERKDLPIIHSDLLGHLTYNQQSWNE